MLGNKITDDFSFLFTGNSPPLDDENPPSTEFQFLQVFGKVIVFVLDISGSMAVNNILMLFLPPASKMEKRGAY